MKFQTRVLEISKSSQNIFIYFAKKDELPTKEIIETLLDSGKDVIVPKCISETEMKCYQINYLNNLRTGAFNILEPNESCKEISKDNIDIYFIPGRKFDTSGNRKGRGKGYFDRLLIDIETKKPIVALAYDNQIQEKLIVKDHDIPVDLILTETKEIRCNDRFSFR